MPESLRALLVTTCHYDDDRLLPLSGPWHDGRLLRDALQAHGGAEVLHLPEHSTEDVKRELERFLDSFDDTQTAVVYFSGHGLREDDKLYLATRNTDRELLSSTAVEASWVRGLLDGCAARAKVWILDCCHAAAAGARPAAGFKGLAELPSLSAGPAQFKGDDPAPVRQGRGLAVLAAVGAEQRAPDGEHGSVYTTVLVEGITSGRADLDRDGWVSADELAHYAYGEMRARLPGVETRHFVDDAAGRIRLTRVGRRRAPTKETAQPPDLVAPAVPVLVALLVGTGIWLTRHHALGSVVAGLVVGLLAYAGYVLTRRSTART